MSAAKRRKNRKKKKKALKITQMQNICSRYKLSALSIINIFFKSESFSVLLENDW